MTTGQRVRAALLRAWAGLAIVGGTTLVALGVFRRPTGSPLPLLFAVVLGGLFIARLSAYIGRPHRARPVRPDDEAKQVRAEVQADLELGGLLLVAAYASFQATGGPRSILHPLAYALAAFVITFHRRPVGLPLAGFAILLEVALFVGRGAPLARDGRILLFSHIGFVAFFAAMHLVLLQAEIARQRREQKQRLAEEMAQMRVEARDFRLISSQLGAASRTRSREEEEEIIALGAVETIHQALYYVLEVLKKSLDLHTCMLLWLDDSGDNLKIKELVTDSDYIVEEEIPVDAGVLAAVVKDRMPVALRDPKREHLPYYSSAEPIAAFLGVPVVEEAPRREKSGPHALPGSDKGYLRGILIADRRRPGGGRERRADDRAVPFDQKDEALLVGATRQILRAIQSERVFTAVERSKYEHERFYRASDLLNRALTPDQVFATAFQSAREICEFDFAAITLYDKLTRKHHVAAATGEGAAEVEGLAFAENAGLAAMVVKNKHYLPAGGERRDKEMPVFTKKVKLKGMESLLVLPLIAADEAIGSFTLAARDRQHFPKDKREMLGVIANQVAVSTKNAEMYRAMEQMATTDGLTGLVNHRTFQVRFADLVNRAERHGQAVTLLLTDIDHFKKVNDTHGHPIGDVVLKRVAQVCQDQVRKVDIAARYGGEEFAIVLDGTDLEGARQLAERIRREVQAQSFASEHGAFSCTLSLGIATYPGDGRDPKSLIAHADQSLYQAKHGGRNRAVAWADTQRPAIRALP